MGETIAAIAVIALAIVGLAGVFSDILAAVATIVLGAGILIEGGFFATAQAEAESGSRSWGETGGYMSTEFLGATFSPEVNNLPVS